MIDFLAPNASPPDDDAGDGLSLPNAWPHDNRFMLRAVNILGKDYFERYSGGSTLQISRAAVRGEIGPQNSSYYRQYGWNGKPRSFWLQYEYNF